MGGVSLCQLMYSVRRVEALQRVCHSVNSCIAYGEWRPYRGVSFCQLMYSVW